MPLVPRKPKLGLVLGSGSARGWAHFGVLRALLEAGLKPDIVCGSSIGALVGASYAAGEMQRFEDWVLGLGMRKVLGFMDFNITGGMLKGEKLISFWRENFVDSAIEDLATPFGAVATDLHSGAEVWLRKGSIADAVRASIALPGLFTPVYRDQRLLVDGGIVNPVPTSLARAMGADIVIAVDLNADIMRRHLRPLEGEQETELPDGEQAVPDAEEPAQNMAWMRRLQQGVMSWMPGQPRSDEVTSSLPPTPSLLDVVMVSVNIMQMRITRSRLAGDPPELVIAPRLAQLGLLDFHRAREAIDAGYEAARAALPGLRHWGLENR
ncbi:patatin-like phospholipase family protein [Comamonas composti]|uniref:patatin-like phospholipase family protein n=1 Tax=Comamonas composti TaxID=408558 RepID=UPI0004135550|nr:patatin-like phospholipase family protein [Comamonas composti]